MIELAHERTAFYQIFLALRCSAQLAGQAASRRPRQSDVLTERTAASKHQLVKENSLTLAQDSKQNN